MNAKNIYRNHSVDWYNGDVSVIKFLTAADIQQLPSQRHARAQSMIALQAPLIGGIKQSVSLIAMTDCEIIESHVCQIRFCPSCAEALREISAQSAGRIAA